MGNNLVSRSQYKTYAGITSSNQDAKIDALIPVVSEFVKSYCRRTFVDYYDTDKTEYFRGGDGFYPKELPVKEITSVEYSLDYGKTFAPLAEFTDYVLDQETSQILPTSNSTFIERINGYRITYKGGYEVVPDDLVVAVLDMITYYIKNDSAIHSPKVPGSNTVQIEYISTTSLPANIKRILDIYKDNWI